GGVLDKIGAVVGSIFGTNVRRGRLSTGQLIARNVTRSVTDRVVGGVAADIGKSVGGSIGGSVGRALVRGALGGLFRRLMARPHVDSKDASVLRLPSLRAPLDLLFLFCCVVLTAFVLVPEIWGHGKTKDYPLWYWAGQQVLQGLDLYPSSSGTFYFIYPPL